MKAPYRNWRYLFKYILGGGGDETQLSCTLFFLTVCKYMITCFLPRQHGAAVVSHPSELNSYFRCGFVDATL